MPLFKVEFYNSTSGNKHSEYTDVAEDFVTAEAGARAVFAMDNPYDASQFRTSVSEVQYSNTAVVPVENVSEGSE